MTGEKRVRLSGIASRDRAGPRTGRQYEYQHEQATYSALEMLARREWQCVYCEWHDDFVVESGDEHAIAYVFHQVKSKSLTQGPWSFRDLFGVSPPKLSKGPPAKAKAKPLSVGSDAILLRLLAHQKTFGASCGSLVFVTNTGVDPLVEKLLDAVAFIDSYLDLKVDELVLFEQLARGYCEGASAIVASREELFRLLRRFAAATERGSLKADAALNEICDRVFEYSEIDLLMAERKQIARQLVQLIRAKATDYNVKLPIDDAVLRARKGVVIAEVLGVLSLSHEGYQALLAGGPNNRDVVKTLSRLERFCRAHSDFAPYVSQICLFKARWDAWRTKHRHQIEDSDHATIIAKAREIVATNKPLVPMISMAKEAAISLSTGLPASISISGDDVLGIVFSLAAGAESL